MGKAAALLQCGMVQKEPAAGWVCNCCAPGGSITFAGSPTPAIAAGNVSTPEPEVVVYSGSPRVAGSEFTVTYWECDGLYPPGTVAMATSPDPALDTVSDVTGSLPSPSVITSWLRDIPPDGLVVGVSYAEPRSESFVEPSFVSFAPWPRVGGRVLW